jgi:hypothetical protein
MLLHGIESTAAGTAAHPFGGFVAAAGAEKDGFCLSHGILPSLRVFLDYSNNRTFGQAQNQGRSMASPLSL